MTELKTTAIKQVKLLMLILKSTENEIAQLIADKHKYYYVSYKPKLDEHRKPRFDEQGNPVMRELNPSKGRLKEIQKIINSRILTAIQLPTNVKGGVKGYSNIANAAVHLGKKYKFKTDMKSYFPSVSFERVFQMFLDNGFSTKVASILTHLTTHKHALPQGTPTSSTLANLIFLPYDHQVIAFCKIHKLTYSRFIDDLVFSSPKDFSELCCDLIAFILNAGFKVSYKKTQYKAGKMEITGVLTKLNVLDSTPIIKELIADQSFNTKATAGRQLYHRNIRQFK